MEGFTDKIEWIVGAIVAFGAVLVGMVRVISGKSTPCEREMQVFQDRLQRDMDNLQAALKHAVRHAEEQHDRLFNEVAALKTGQAVLETRLTNCQERIRKIDNGKSS